MPTQRHRIRAIFFGQRLDRELDDEMASHVDRLTERFQAEGFEAGEARRRALLRFGGVQQLREEARDARGLSVLRDLGERS